MGSEPTVPVVAPVPFGWWPSPLTAASVAAGRISRSGLHPDDGRFVWCESRPAEGGRQVVVADRDGDPPVERSPAGVSVRTRVHEYGGGAALSAAGRLWFVDLGDQRLYRVDGPDRAPVPLTPASGAPPVRRWADASPTRSGRWLVCVEERLDPDRTSHRLVAVATDGSLRTEVVVAGGGFVAAPRVSPDGRLLAWVGWDHPAMPWDASTLWVADLDDGPAPGVRGARRVAGGADNSVGQPRWMSDGGLLYVDDRTGWWLPYRLEPDRVDAPGPGTPALVELEAEFHAPDWALGQATVAEAADGSVVTRMHRDGRDHLVRLVPPGDRPARPWTVERIDQPCVSLAGVAVAGDRLAVLGSTPDAASVVLELGDGGRGPVRELSTPTPTAGGGTASTSPVVPGEPFVAATPSGPVPGLVYLPDRRTTVGPPGDRPPLVVFCHGGPTGATDPGWNPVVQFLVSRGLAVAAVDYRGSSGYGRAYRRALEGRWGVADVEDCTAYARALADTGRVDGRRMAVRGTSAGGLTALGALVDSDCFLGAVAWYGVTDLESLATDTHDFESRYLDGLVGPFPAARDEYRRRSPLHRAADLQGAVLLLQGADDPVVPLAQARRMAETLAGRGIRCELQVFEGESHGFRRAATVEACLRSELGFYRSLFGGAPTAADVAPGRP